MINKAWQIWSVFSLCLILAALAMAWMSFRTAAAEQNREHDRRQTELARREAELLERTSSAMYRMDWFLSPIVIQEAARSHLDYHVFHKTSLQNAPDDNPVSLVRLSQLTTGLPDFVKLHFEIGADGTVFSPQAPTDVQVQQFEFPLDELELKKFRALAHDAARTFGYQQLLALCPADRLPDVLAVDHSLASDGNQQSVYQMTIPVADSVASLENDDSQLNDIDKPILAQQQSRGQIRGNSEYVLRQNSVQEVGVNQLSNNMRIGTGNLAFIDSGQNGRLPILMNAENKEGVIRPVWVGNELLLVRRVGNGQGSTLSGEKTRVQCCWLDWAGIQVALQERVKDLLSDVQFEKVKSINELKPETALATLPVQLVVNKEAILSTLALDQPDGGSPERTGLWPPLLLAWLGFGVAAVASAVLLNGVMKLSERRAAFVSAVTHELRTPLTTFRMYAEMLAGDMVPEQKRQQYAQTLKVQADRLSHLVENVLQFARLERGPGEDVRETLRVDALLERIGERLEERATEADMCLLLEFDPEMGERQVRTLSAMVELVLFNLVDNACKYARSAADRRVIVSCREDVRAKSNALQISVRDFGPGIPEQYRQRMFHAFWKAEVEEAVPQDGTKPPGVGLGLALCRRIADSLGGRLTYLHGREGNGSEFVLELPLEQ